MPDLSLLALSLVPLSLLALTVVATAAAPRAPAILITPLTDVIEHPPGGYFSDPDPIPILTRSAPPPFQLFSGTTVAQRMTSPTALAAAGPVTLLEPEPGPGLNAEPFLDHGTARFTLVETGNITVIDGEYAMAYSTGGLQERDDKTGIAWSETFLPALNTFHRKLFRPDPTGIRGRPGPEVQYLLQSEQPARPSDVAAEIVSPGDHPLEENDPDDFEPDHRSPFVTPLKATIPPDATVARAPVARAPDAQLATWIEPVTAP